MTDTPLAYDPDSLRPDKRPHQPGRPGLLRGAVARPEATAARPRCQWCNRVAMRGQIWCSDHRPGPRAKRRPGPPAGRTVCPPSIRAVMARQEWAARHLLPAVVLAWAPCVRLDAQRPVGSRVHGLRHVLRALAAEASGDTSAWPTLARTLADAGFLLPEDGPRPVLAPASDARTLHLAEE